MTTRPLRLAPLLLLGCHGSCSEDEPAAETRLPCTSTSGAAADFEILVSEDVQAELRDLCPHGFLWFDRLDLADRDLAGVHLPGLNVQAGTWTGVGLREARLTGLVLKPGVLLRDVDLTRAVLQDAFLNHVQLERVTFAGADLGGAHLVGDGISNVSFEGAAMRELQLRATEGTGLISTTFAGADLRGANIACPTSAVSFASADLTEATLWLKEGSTADFHGAVLRGADFLYTPLAGIELTGADVRGADFSNAQGAPEDCTDMSWDETTKLPAGRTMAEWCPSAPPPVPDAGG